MVSRNAETSSLRKIKASHQGCYSISFDPRLVNFTVQQVVCHHETNLKLELERNFSMNYVRFVVSTLTGVNKLLCHNFTQCVSQPYSKFDTLLSIYIMCS